MKVADRTLTGRVPKYLGQKMQGLETPNYLKPDYIKSLPSKFKGMEPTTESLPKPLGKMKVRYVNGKFIDVNTGEELGPFDYKNEFTPWKGAKDIVDKFDPHRQIFPSFRGKR